MNTNMFENPIVQDNLEKLRNYGYEVIDPASGYLACGDTGAGKMPEPTVLESYIMKNIAMEKDMAGKKVLITAGPTMEAIDPVDLSAITQQVRWVMPLQRLRWNVVLK